ncbi:ribosome-recycling factor, mitochondrial isoform X2 [Camarhynchus parvulus]|uniref:ribosome-recycling factor, mitochondrial isoform X2 n=1 Tax=Geospiza parvula TaxID=87175 RepID=UPI0012383AF8|nr:ribosome-recycling factor, mitochondrial isoform X2 [Camarhynchus parvulus]
MTLSGGAGPRYGERGDGARPSPPPFPSPWPPPGSDPGPRYPVLGAAFHGGQGRADRAVLSSGSGVGTQHSAMALALRCLRPLPPLLLRSAPAVARALPRAPGGCPAPLPGGCSRCVQHLLLSRQLATKKAKGKGQSQAKVNISAALVEDIINLEETSEDMQAVIEALKEDFSRNLSVRTSPGALDHITVVTKDGKFPLNQLGQISQKSPQLLTVNMSSFPESTAAAAKAIRESGMNLNPEVDGTVIRVPVPKFKTASLECCAELADFPRWTKAE